MTNQCQHGQLARVCLICEQVAEITRLTVERDWLMKKAQQSGREIDRLTKETLELRAQVAALEVDAGRYRWLRDPYNQDCHSVGRCEPDIERYDAIDWLYGDELDTSIDAALAARKGEA